MIKSSGGSDVKLTDEQKVGVVLLIAGMAVVAATQIIINAYPQSGGFTTPAAGQQWPWWREISWRSWNCPSYLIHYQEIGVAALASGITIMIRARVSFKR